MFIRGTFAFKVIGCMYEASRTARFWAACTNGDCICNIAPSAKPYHQGLTADHSTPAL